MEKIEEIELAEELAEELVDSVDKQQIKGDMYDAVEVQDWVSVQTIFEANPEVDFVNSLAGTVNRNWELFQLILMRWVDNISSDLKPREQKFQLKHALYASIWLRNTKYTKALLENGANCNALDNCDRWSKLPNENIRILFEDFK